MLIVTQVYKFLPVQVLQRGHEGVLPADGAQTRAAFMQTSPAGQRWIVDTLAIPLTHA